MTRKENEFYPIEDKVKYYQALDWDGFTHWDESKSSNKIQNTEDGVCDFNEIIRLIMKTQGTEEGFIKHNEIYSFMEDNAVNNPLSRIILSNKSEWNKNNNNLLRKRYEHSFWKFNEIDNFIWVLESQQFADKVDIMKDNKKLHYIHPLQFVEQMKTIIPRITTINPYQGEPIRSGDKEIVVIDSPGFAPLHDEREGFKYYEYNSKKYARVTGLFDEDYLHVGTYRDRYKEFYHEGVDFGAAEGTKVISFTYGEVIAVGEMGSFGKIILIKDDLKNDILYLLAHLSKQLVYEGGKVFPFMEVGEVGKTGGDYKPHLHIGVLKTLRVKKDEIVNIDNTTKQLFFNKDRISVNYFNPFDHNDNKKRLNIPK